MVTALGMQDFLKASSDLCSITMGCIS
jgi:hypothetical protein